MEDGDTVLGLIQTFSSVILFGSQFIPIKCTGLDAGDGFFSHFMICIGTVTVGFTICIIEGFPPIYPIAMAGGVSWATNNCVAIIIIHQLGLGLTILLFSITGCLISFLMSYFGWFGLQARPPSHPILSFAGLALIVVGGTLISLVKNKPRKVKKLVKPMPFPREIQPIKKEIIKEVNNSDSVQTITTTVELPPMIQREGPNVDEHGMHHHAGGLKRSLFIGFALLFGLFGSFTTAPMVIMEDNPDIFVGYPLQNLPYLFSIHFGIFLQGIIVFIGYCIYKRNRPFINPQLAMPSFISGLFYGCGSLLFVMSMQNLSMGIAGPIASIGPGCVASIWGVLYFREIKEGKNTWILFGAILITFLGSLAIGLSK